MKIISEVAPKENIKDSGVETKADKLFFFKEQSLVKNSEYKSKYLTDNQIVFLRRIHKVQKN